MTRRRTAVGLRIALVVAVAAAGGGCVTSYFNDAALHPGREFALIPADLGLVSESFVVPVDGAQLHAWRFRGPPGAPVVVVFGGNTGTRQLYLPLAESLLEAGYGVVLYDHRGFGLSTGEPDLWSLVPDAAAVLRAVKAEAGGAKVAAYGISLGSVAALGAAAVEPVDAIVVEGLVSPREQLERLVGPVLGGLVRLLVFPDGWNVEDHVAEVEAPILFIHGTEDRITPLAPAEALFEAAAAAAAPRETWIAAGAGHAPGVAGMYGAEYARRVRDFLGRRLRGEPPLPEGDERAEDRAAYRELQAVEAAVVEDLGTGGILRIGGRTVWFRVDGGEKPPDLAQRARRAERRLTRALARLSPDQHPALAPLFFELARAWAAAGRAGRALSCYETGIALYPDPPWTWWRFYDAAWDLGRPIDEVEAALQAMARLVRDPARRAEYEAREREWAARRTARWRELARWRAAEEALLQR